MDIKRVVSYRHWCNKLWNAIRFAIMNLGDDFQPRAAGELETVAATLPYPSKWILSRLNAATKSITDAMYAYDFATSTSAVYSFWQYELCDIYIELAKPLLNGDDAVAKDLTRQTLYVCLESGLRLLHPFMPFVTEELWQRLPGQAKNLQQEGYPRSLMVAKYPTPVAAWEDDTLSTTMSYMMSIVNKVRSLRSEYGLTREKAALYVTATDPANFEFIQSVYLEIETLTTSSSVKAVSSPDQAPKSCGVAVLDDTTTVHLDLLGVLDVAKEVEKLEKKLKQSVDWLAKLEAKTSSEMYIAKTPENIKQVDADKVAKLRSEIESTEHHIAEFKSML